MHYKDPNHLVATLLTGLLTMPGCGGDGTTDTTSDGPGDCEAALEKGQLVISEIMADPHGADDSSFEWFELYNPTSIDLSLTGIGLEYSKLDGSGGKGHRIKEPLTLAAGGYMAFGKATAETKPQYIGYGYGADLGSLGNTAGKLRVVCGNLTVDEVLYQDLKDGYSRSLGTHPPDAEANDDLTAWCLASAAYQADEYGSPGAENPSCPLPPTECGQCYENGQLRASQPPTADQLVISEIMPNAKLTDGTVGEWFELKVLDGPVDLNCLQYGANTTKFLTDPTRPDKTIQASECITVNPGTIELFAEHEEWPGVDFGVKFAVVDTPSDSNPNPGIYVAYDGTILDEAHYTKTTDGVAWSLDPDALTPAGNDDPANWCLAVDMFAEGDLGTPGAENPQCPEVVKPGTCLGADAKPRDIDYAAPGELLVTELLTAPGLADHTLGEWIELVVVADLDLNGITLGKTLETPYTTIADPACLPIPAGTIVLLAKTDDTSTNGMLPSPDWIGPKIALTNDNSTLVVGVNNQTTMTVAQLDAISWANTADGKSRQFPFGLIPDMDPIDATINDDPAAWCDATQSFGVGDFGTPKADNLNCDGPPPGDQCMDAKTMTLRPIQHPGVGDLIITELHADPDALIKSGGAGEPTGEWFEIYAAVDFDLNGVSLGNTFPTAKHTVTSDTCLPVLADSYALLASIGKPTVPPNDMDSGGNGGLPLPTYEYTTLGLSNSGSSLFIGLGDVELDAVTFPKASPGKAAQLSLAANCLGPAPLDPACNDDFAANWCLASTPYGLGDAGTPQAENLACGNGNMDPMCFDPGLNAMRPVVPPKPGDLVINEFMADPNLVTDANGEWFEVAALADVDLNDLKFLNKANPDMATIAAAKPTLVDGNCLPAKTGSFVLFARQADPMVNGGLPAVDYVVSTSLTNTNGGLTLALGDMLLHSIGWVSTQKPGKSTALDPDGILDPMNSVADGPPWCISADAGTPKQANPQCP